MTPLFKKLNYKTQPAILVLGHPASFEPEVLAMGAETVVQTSLPAAGDFSFILAFVSTRAGVDKLCPVLTQRLPGDGVLWFAYPKQSSKKYKADINRDNGWQPIQMLGFESVRAVSIDEDWSALRFRRTSFIKLLTRQGKAPTP